jgi:hypothetical protein
MMTTNATRLSDMLSKNAGVRIQFTLGAMESGRATATIASDARVPASEPGDR